MERRKFASCLVAGCLASSLPVQARSQDDKKDDRDSDEGFGHIELRLISQVVIPSRLVIVQDRFLQEIRLDQTFTYTNEDRLGFLTPTVRQTFKGATEVGDVVLRGRELVVRPTTAVQLGVIQLLNGSTAYRINAEKLAKQRVGSIPLLGDLPVIGAMFRAKNGPDERRNLLIVIRPTIIDDKM